MIFANDAGPSAMAESPVNVPERNDLLFMQTQVGGVKGRNKNAELKEDSAIRLFHLENGRDLRNEIHSLYLQCNWLLLLRNWFHPQKIVSNQENINIKMQVSVRLQPFHFWHGNVI
jgi:hypothetical protein